SARSSATTRRPPSRTKRTRRGRASVTQRSRSACPLPTSTGSSTPGRWSAIPGVISGWRTETRVHSLQRRRLPPAAANATALAIACLTSYLLAAEVLSKAHSLSTSDDLVGGVWSVIATLFVYRESERESVAAALTRASGTLVSFALCFVYLMFFSFHAVG